MLLQGTANQEYDSNTSSRSISSHLEIAMTAATGVVNEPTHLEDLAFVWH